MQLSLSPPLAFATSRYSQVQVVFLMVPGVLFCCFLLLLVYLQWQYHPKDKRLPPGSMGWPYIGETLKLYAENPNSFFFNRQKRYTKATQYVPYLYSSLFFSLKYFCVALFFFWFLIIKLILQVWRHF